jgi:hypothetical protein
LEELDVPLEVEESPLEVVPWLEEDSVEPEEVPLELEEETLEFEDVVLPQLTSMNRHAPNKMDLRPLLVITNTP